MKELIVIAIIALLLFGSKRIPQLSEDVVQAIKHFRRAFKDDDTKEVKKR